MDHAEGALTPSQLKLICRVLWGPGSTWSALASEELGINRRTLTRMASGREDNMPGAFLTPKLRHILEERVEALKSDISSACQILGLE